MSDYKTTRDWNRWIFLKQLILIITIISFNFLNGLTMGTPTVAVPQLRKIVNSTSAVSEEMASWITSIVPVTAIGWAISLQITTHYFGRKKPAFVVTIASTCAFAILYCSINVMHLFYSQMIQGVLHAASTTIGLMMLLEYAKPKYRGPFMTFKIASYSCGLWVANAVGMFFNYKYIGIIGMSVSLFVSVLIFILPESPYWLASRKRYDECAISHRWLMGSDEETEEELKVLVNTHKNINKDDRTKRSIEGHVHYFVKIAKKPEVYKPFLLCLLMVLFFHFSGKTICAIYALEVLTKIFESESNAYKTMLILDGVTVASTYLCAFLVILFRRRSLLISSSLSCVVLLLILSIYKYLIFYSFASENAYILVGMLIAYTVSAGIGPIGVVGAVIGDIFPRQHRTLLVSAYGIMSKLVFAIFLKIGPTLLKQFEIQGAFLFFGISLTVCMVVIYKYLPESKDKTTEELVEIFRKQKSGGNRSETNTFLP